MSRMQLLPNQEAVLYLASSYKNLGDRSIILDTVFSTLNLKCVDTSSFTDVLGGKITVDKKIEKKIKQFKELYRDTKLRQFLDAVIIADMQDEKILAMLYKYFKLDIKKTDFKVFKKMFFSYEEMSYHAISLWFKFTKTQDELTLLSRAWLKDIDYILNLVGEQVDLDPDNIYKDLLQDSYYTYKELMTLGDYKEARNWLSVCHSLVKSFKEAAAGGSAEATEWEARIKLLSGADIIPPIHDLTKD